MPKPRERTVARAADFDEALADDAGLMRLHSGIWYVNLALFALWLGCAVWQAA